MSKNKGTKVALEEEVNNLKKHFGGIVATVKALMEKVVSLEKRSAPKETDEVNELLEKQKAVEVVMAKNSAALERIDKEIVMLTKKVMVSDSSKVTITNKISDKASKIDKADKAENKGRTLKCRYFNRGFCKYKNKCRFGHPRQICSDYLENGKCEKRPCDQRHPKQCKWDKSDNSCRRGAECLY